MFELLGFLEKYEDEDLKKDVCEAFLSYLKSSLEDENDLKDTIIKLQTEFIDFLY